MGVAGARVWTFFKVSYLTWPGDLTLRDLDSQGGVQITPTGAKIKTLSTVWFDMHSSALFAALDDDYVARLSYT